MLDCYIYIVWIDQRSSWEKSVIFVRF